jgi:uncharacterized protein (DUF952 family)
LTDQTHATAQDSRNAGIAYHLIPAPVWEEFKGRELYQPEAYDQDGFIHLTLGIEPLLAVANLFYTGDTREFKVLVLDTNRIQSPVKYEDPDEIYPHIYGLLNTDAVIGELSVDRASDGSFTGIVAR